MNQTLTEDIPADIEIFRDVTSQVYSYSGNDVNPIQ